MGMGGQGQEAACSSSSENFPHPKLLGCATRMGRSGTWCVHFIKVLGGAEGLSWNEPSEAPCAHLRWITIIILPLLLFTRELIIAGYISSLSQVSFPSEIWEDV